MLKKVIEFAAGRNLKRGTRVDVFPEIPEIPEIPVMPETLLCVDLCTHGKSIDLRAISQCALGDLGATLQIMRYAEEGFNRIEDYISSLGVEACVEAMAKRILSHDMDKTRIRQTWTHARLIAEKCRELAEETADKTNPNQAYLVGLLHELGSLPAILEWDAVSRDIKRPELFGLRLAQAWRLPLCVNEYFCGLQGDAGTNDWTELVRHAHEGNDASAEQRRSTEIPEIRIIAKDRAQLVLA